MTSARDLIALARTGCARCLGVGWFIGGLSKKAEMVCGCVDRGVCRLVIRAYHFYSDQSGALIRTNLSQFSRPSNRQGGRANGRKAEEFTADVWLCAKRTLTPRQWNIFRRHHIGAEEWHQFGMDKGTFFHEVYRLEQKLGHVFREQKPFPLFPIDEYMRDSSQSLLADIRPCFPVVPRVGRIPLVPPLRPAPIVECARPEPVASVGEVRVVKVPVVPAVVTMPAPAAPDTYTAEQHARRRFAEGKSLIFIAKDLRKWAFPAPSGETHWMAGDVKRILLAKRAA